MKSASERGILGEDSRAWRRQLAELVASRFEGHISVQAIGAVLGDAYSFKTEKNSWVASVLGVRKDWLTTGTGKMLLDASDIHELEEANQGNTSFPASNTFGLTSTTARVTPIVPVTPQPSAVEVITWEQLMESIHKEGLASLKGGVWVAVNDDSMTPEFCPGDEIMVRHLEGNGYKAGDRVLVREAGGDILLREYRALTTKTFEAVPLNPAYGTLHSATHQLEVLAKVVRLTKIYR